MHSLYTALGALILVLLLDAMCNYIIVQWLKKLLKCLPVFERLHCYGMMM